MDERKAAILRAVIEEYIATAQPVASSKVAAGLDVSSATVRNEMNELEREGYLSQPHTSAGRVPTDLGYRFFVDQLRAPTPLPTRDERAISDFFTESHRALEDMLSETSALLTDLTGYAAVVVGPEANVATIKSVQLIDLQPGVVLLVAVLSTGAVEKATLMVPEVPDAAALTARASVALADGVTGRTLATVGAPRSTGDAALDALVAMGHQALADLARASEQALHVAGTGKLATEAFPSSHEAVRLLDLLEQQVVVVTMVRDILATGLEVRIGSENTLDELQHCSLVLARFTGEGSMRGTVGVLGSTRMDYNRALATVAAVSDRLGRTLQQ
jgi:heat-inducible transcriptional repressor